jgi:hypothetical protein
LSGHGPKESKMRNNLLVGISSVVAAVAVAGSANAAIVTTGAINQSSPSAGLAVSVDINSNGAYSTGGTAFTIVSFDWSASTSSVFIGGSYGSSAAGAGGYLLELAGTRTTYRADTKYAAGATIDSSIGTLSDEAASGSGFFYGDNGNTLKASGTSASTPGQFKNASGYLAFRFSSNTTNGVDGNWYYGWIGYTGAESSGTITGWAYNTVADQGIIAGGGAVPAPGAAALLGLAGLVGARRRKA